MGRARDSDPAVGVGDDGLGGIFRVVRKGNELRHAALGMAQRCTRVESDVFYRRKLPDAVKRFTVERRRLRSRREDPNIKQGLAGYSVVESACIHEAVNHETGSGQQYERDADLADRQPMARLQSAGRPIGGAGTFLQGGGKICFRRAPGGRKAEEKNACERNEKAEAQDAGIEVEV